MIRLTRTCLTTLAVVLLAATAHAVDIEWVTVGDPENVGETQSQGTFGSVADTYRIGKYEVTNGQYIEFLSAVATTTDPNGLYSSDMSGIERTGSAPYSYGAKGSDPNWLGRPVNYVSWYDTLRFANWLHNGQPTGAQGTLTTEDGAYDMSLGVNPVRKPGATAFLPSEDEWYKAAYYKGGSTNAGYWDYPTQSDTAPTAEVPAGTDMVNGSASYANVIGSPYYMTEVGAYDAKPSDGPYGTFDQGGNMWEWNEALLYGSARGLRGGSIFINSDGLRATYRDGLTPSNETYDIGFRVASVPEPSTALLTTLGLFGLLAARLRRRR